MKGISKQLQDIVNSAKPKSGTVIFESVNIKYDKVLNRTIIPNSDRVPNTCVIYDPGTKTSVNISYIKSERPAPADSMRDTVIELGDIEFTREDNGRMSIPAGRRDREALFEYLFLCPWNADNQTKEWYVKPNSPFIFKAKNAEKDATGRIENRRRIREAEEIVDAMGNIELETIAQGMFDDYAIISQDEARDRLQTIAASNPEKILTISSDAGIKMTAFIKTAQKEGLILHDDETSRWVWPEGKDTICVVVPGKSPEESLKSFLLTKDGAKVVTLIETLISGGKKPKK